MLLSDLQASKLIVMKCRFVGMKYSTPRQLNAFLKPYDRSVRELALSLRELVLDEMGPCYENIYDAYSAVAMGYGTSERLSDGIFHIAVYGSHVNLGFNFGATLDDPANILEGMGKQTRHISIKAPEDLQQPEIQQYLRRAINQSADDARKLGETAPPKPNKIVSTVKAIYKRKRRPGGTGKSKF